MVKGKQERTKPDGKKTSSSGGVRSDRPNGKAYKKRPKSNPRPRVDADGNRIAYGGRSIWNPKCRGAKT